MSRRVAVLASVLFLNQTIAPVLAADTSQVNFKIFSPPGATQPAEGADTAKSADPAASSAESMWSEGDASSQAPPGSQPAAAAPAADLGPSAAPVDASPSTTTSSDASTTTTAPSTDSATTSSVETPKTDATADATSTGESKDGKVLQGYIRVVPSGTKLPIIMDSAVDSDTSQEGDEFAARTSEDLTIDGSTVVPAGSVIKGRIARINPPKHLSRSGSVGLKFDTITTPDNKQIALQATLVARGGVVHARRGLKDISLDTGMVVAPMLLGAAIGAIAGGASSNSSNSSGSSSNKLGTGGGLLVGVGVGTAIGIIILCAKKGKRVDMRPGDELKIELAEDLRMPM